MLIEIRVLANIPPYPRSFYPPRLSIKDFPLGLILYNYREATLIYQYNKTITTRFAKN